MRNDAVAIKHIVNVILNIINHSCFNVIPMVLKTTIAVLLTALIIILFLISICFIVGVPYYFITEYVKNRKQKSAVLIFKDVCNLMLNRVTNPNKKNYSLEILNRNLPLIAILMLFLRDLKSALPIMIFVCLTNNKIQNKLHYKLNFWAIIYLLTIICVYYSLIF